MDWLRYAGLSERWQSLSRGHAALVNARLRRGEHDPAPEAGDDRASLAEDVLAVVREASSEGDVEGLRGAFAPSHLPFESIVSAHGQPVGPLFMLDDGRLVVVVGSPWQRPQVWVATASSVEPLLGVFALGRSPDRRVYALGRADGVYLSKGWGEPPIAVLPWPVAYAPTHADMPLPTVDGRPVVGQLLPFDDGARVVVVSRSGVFLLEASGSRLIHPGELGLDLYVDEDGDEAFPLDLDGVHAALSPDQGHIVAGDQASRHRIMKHDGALIAAVEPVLGYPSQSTFSADGRLVVLSSRQGSDGRVLQLPVAQVRADLHFAPASAEPSSSTHGSLPTPIDRSVAPVTSILAQHDGYWLGGADGFLRRCGSDLTTTGSIFLGGEVRSIDASVDGRTLAVCTTAGIVHRIELSAAAADVFAIGTIEHRESRRWIFWQNEASPLIW